VTHTQLLVVVVHRNDFWFFLVTSQPLLFSDISPFFCFVLFNQSTTNAGRVETNKLVGFKGRRPCHAKNGEKRHIFGTGYSFRLSQLQVCKLQVCPFLYGSLFLRWHLFSLAFPSLKWTSKRRRIQTWETETKKWGGGDGEGGADREMRQLWKNGKKSKKRNKNRLKRKRKIF